MYALLTKGLGDECSEASCEYVAREPVAKQTKVPSNPIVWAQI